MARRNWTELTNQEILDLIDPTSIARRSDVYKFIQYRSIKDGDIFYKTGFLYHLYIKDGFPPIGVKKFSQYFRKFFTYYRKYNKRGYMLFQLKFDPRDAITYDKKTKTKKRSIKSAL